MSRIALAATLLRLLLVLAVCATPAAAQQRQRPERPRGPRPGHGLVQERSYQFVETNETLPYALFVSSKVRPDQKAPLIVALHAMGADHMSLLRGPVLKMAEEGGYIVAGPMGYDPRGWYGSPPFTPGGRVPREPPDVSERSEKDVLNVLDLVRHEFNVDENRIYLLGHSMGGAGAFHLAVKYPKTWAAIAALAPASFNLKASSLAAIPDMPVIVVQGDADPSVPVEMTRSWVDYMKAHKMPHRYIEVPGGNHSSVIPQGMPDVFAFFGEHVKWARR
jgi:predicted peptidase